MFTANENNQKPSSLFGGAAVTGSLFSSNQTPDLFGTKPSAFNQPQAPNPTSTLSAQNTENKPSLFVQNTQPTSLFSNAGKQPSTILFDKVGQEIQQNNSLFQPIKSDAAPAKSLFGANLQSNDHQQKSIFGKNDSSKEQQSLFKIGENQSLLKEQPQLEKKVQFQQIIPQSQEQKDQQKSSLFGASNQNQQSQKNQIEENQNQIQVPQTQQITEAVSIQQQTLKEAPKAQNEKSEKDFADKKEQQQLQLEKSFSKTPINTIAQKWNQQLLRNKLEFESNANFLQEYELKLIKQIKALELIENSSVLVQEQYKINIQNLNEIQNQQDNIITELSQIESELDNILPHYSEYFQDQSIGLNQENGFNQDISVREQVYVQANQIEKHLQDLNQEVQEVNGVMDQYQLKQSDEQFKIREFQYAVNGIKPQRGSYGAFETQENIEKILTVYYDTLKWVQGSAIDLQYQTQQIEEKLKYV